MNDELRNSIAKHLQAARKEHGYKSAKSLADALGITQSKYTEYEQGRVSCPLDVAWKIADLFNCSLDELAGREWRSPALTDNEEKLVDAYRSMTKRQRDGLMAFLPAVADGGNGADGELSEEAV